VGSVQWIVDSGARGVRRSSFVIGRSSFGSLAHWAIGSLFLHVPLTKAKFGDKIMPVRANRKDVLKSP
jgi:hypothetical protein